MYTKVSPRRIEEFASTIQKIAPMSSYDLSSVVPAVAYERLLAQGWTPENGVVDPDITDYIEHVMSQYAISSSNFPESGFSNDELIGIILSDYWCNNGGNYYGEHTTSEGLLDVVVPLTDIETGSKIADFGCGTGSYMLRTSSTEQPHSFFGVDINYESVVLSRMRASVLDINAIINHGDLFEVSGKFDRIFLHPPFGTTVQSLERTRKINFASLFPAGVWGRSADWFYIFGAFRNLAVGGRIVAVVPNGALINESDALIRQHAVLTGMVEAVIALPEKMLYGTKAAANILVLSKNNTEITFVDATDLGKKERRNTAFTTKDVEKLLARLNEPDCRSAVRLNINKVTEKDWPLTPSRYLSLTKINNGVALESLVSEITRGANIPSRELDRRITTEPTPYRYLMIKDVVNGEISNDLPFITDLKPGENRHCLNDGDIIIGKMSPFKVAIARIKPGEQILCTGNLYIIRPNYDKASPEFIKLFLESDIGLSQLKAACVGTTIATVPIKALEKIQVPGISREEQDRIEIELEAINDEIELYKIKIEKALARAAALIPRGD